MADPSRDAIDAIRDALPAEARDLSLNLQTVLDRGASEAPVRFGIALACAWTVDDPGLVEALLSAGAAHGLDDALLSDARAAASLMAMNNVYYRFRHMVGDPTYSERPAGLRMTRLIRTASDKATFELMCLAVSAINGCEMCVRSHERTVRKHGLGVEAVHDAVRIASTIAGVATARRIAGR